MMITKGIRGIHGGPVRNVVISQESNSRTKQVSVREYHLIDLLSANNRIIWLGTSFRFKCPLCRKSIIGTVMLAP